jgi:hypothetical protein
MHSTFLAVALSFSLFLCCVLQGCATSYGPKGLKGGYEDTQLAPDKWALTYQGNHHLGPHKTQEAFLRRAAELAASGGYDWFTIEGEGANSSFTPLAIGGGSSTSTASTSGSIRHSRVAPRADLEASTTTHTTHRQPTYVNMGTHVRSGTVQGYKDGSQPSGALSVSTILKPYK